MSVYTRPDSAYFWAEFQIDGVRFRLSTGETDRRKAKAAETRLKAEKCAELESDRQKAREWGGKPPPTLGYCSARYWQEVGQHHAAAETTWRSLEWLTDHFGVDTLLPDIDDGRIAEMAAKRRGIRVERDKKTKRLVEIPSNQVSNATVNRYAIEPLRKLFRRARDVWLYPVPYPKWKDLLLPEAGEREREASQDEERSIIEALSPDYARLFRFMVAAGPRVGGALLTWPQIDRLNRTARIRNKSKDGQERWYTIPLSRAAMAILQECEGHHPVFVFTYEAKRTLQSRKLPAHRLRTKGVRYPITDNGFKAEWRRAVREKGIAPGFRRHDTRHTTGTRFLRTTGNLKATARLLGHSRVETTTRYAHVLVEDIRAGLEAMEEANAPAAAPAPNRRANEA